MRLGDRKVTWERWVKREMGEEVKEPEGGYSAFLRAVAWYYELEERRK